MTTKWTRRRMPMMVMTMKMTMVVITRKIVLCRSKVRFKSSV